MNKFDRVRVVVRGVQVEILAPHKFTNTLKPDPATGDILSVKYFLDKKVQKMITGLQDLVINYMPDDFCTVTLDFTGKFLSSEYKNLINKENILKYIERVNELGLVQLDVQDFLQKSKVRLLHSTIDVQVEEPPINYLNYLHHLVSKKGTAFEAKHYNNGNVDLRRNAETNRQPITVYDKCKELKKRKNALLRELLGDEGLEPFNQVIRFEQKLPNVHDIYQAFNITSKDNSLLSILHSDIYPVVNTLNTLFNSLEVPNV